MAKARVIETYNGTPILYDGNLYYVPDGFGDFYFFHNLDDARARIDGLY